MSFSFLCSFLLVQPETSVKKRLTLGAAEAEFNFFKDPRSHGAPKGYTLHSTEVNIIFFNCLFPIMGRKHLKFSLSIKSSFQLRR